MRPVLAAVDLAARAEELIALKQSDQAVLCLARVAPADDCLGVSLHRGHSQLDEVRNQDRVGVLDEHVVVVGQIGKDCGQGLIQGTGLFFVLPAVASASAPAWMAMVPVASVELSSMTMMRLTGQVC